MGFKHLRACEDIISSNPIFTRNQSQDIHSFFPFLPSLIPFFYYPNSRAYHYPFLPSNIGLLGTEPCKSVPRFGSAADRNSGFRLIFEIAFYEIMRWDRPWRRHISGFQVPVPVEHL